MARTTVEEIRSWLEAALTKPHATHMIVLCDTFDYSDHPVTVYEGQDVREVIKEKEAQDDFTRLMEVYKLSDDIEEQLSRPRCYNY